MPKKKTHEEFLADVKRVHREEYIILGKYEGNKAKILVRHDCEKCNNHEWMVTPDSLLRGSGCPICGKYKSANKRRKTHEQFVKEINEKYKGEYVVLGKYINDNTKILIKHKCDKCNNYEWEVVPSNILQGKKCPKCGGLIKRTTQSFKREIQDKYGDEYTVLGKYKGANKKILVRHNCDKCNNYEYEVRPNNILRGDGCPVCARYRISNKLRKTHEEFVQEIENRYGDEYSILGKYINNHTKIKIRHNCKKCNYYEYEVVPSSILQGQGCPVCSGREVKLGINTIYDTDPWMIDLGVSIDDAKKYSKCSEKEITVTCSDCGRKKKSRISNIYNRRTISCTCGDGKSYPEKFIMNVLDQLGVEYKIEYKPNWINGNKRYDFYIPSIECIIETHGEQHYNGNFKTLGGRNLKQEIENDEYKKEMALKNGIKHYIELDCRKSESEWIKNSILNSKLSKLFDLTKINWNVCAEFANKNIIKEVCEYWNNKKKDESTSDLAKRFKLHKATINKYLKKGNKLYWCSYDPSETRKTRNKTVEILKDNKSLGILKSFISLERQSEELFGVKLLTSGISAVCKGKRKQYKGYTFKYI